MAAPPFSLPRPASQSPHVSTAAWPNIYAIAIAAIGHVTSTAPVGRCGPCYDSHTQLAAGYLVDAAFDA